MCHGAVHSFASLAVVRTLLGAFEAAIQPGTMLLFSMYYTREEQPLRMGIWIGSSGVGYIIAGITSFGIGHIKSSLSSWRLLFIFWGAITFAWGILLWFVLPGPPMRAKFLTEEQKGYAVARVKDNATGIENKRFKMKQFREAMLDLKTWLLFTFALTSNSPNGGLSAVSITSKSQTSTDPCSSKVSSSKERALVPSTPLYTRCRPVPFNWSRA